MTLYGNIDINQVNAIILSSAPVLIVLLYFMVQPNKKRWHKDLPFLLGFAAITEFYIVAPDPSLIYSLYLSQGNYFFPLVVTIVATLFLFIAVFWFRTYRR